MALKVKALNSVRIITTYHPDALIKQHSDAEILAKIRDYTGNNIKYSEWKRKDVEHKAKYAINSYVAAIYNAEWYIGKILEYDSKDNEYNISFMRENVSKVRYRYKWPRKDDILWIAESNILCQVGDPVLFEPFITLVDGPKENEGRVEVYKKGRWGSVCKPLGHIEAAYICRHLGYLGGISAGSGVYGPGRGIFWHINITCLYSRNCEIAMPVPDPTGCDHSQDAAIICDHMIRLTPGEDELSMRNIGRLDMYHNEQYLPVCAENWIPENTRVACRQLGYEDGELTEARENDFLQDGHVWMMEVVCTGSETRLDKCKHSGWSLNGCKSRRPVFLHCH
ncbi:hypothetical protein KUTeg_008707 [Tegillarca granosa]|uniref:SRCR domain-containing protein n=1 Tax=Tegillarca granosa TaxID=220873 RepID=A0ABQ9FC05_TEGGR|nr:hypothetical protein KUTeg_008707 [Tegillarca granosa]